MALKAGVLLVLARVFKLAGYDKWLFALGLAQAGEFGFVLLSASPSPNGVIPAALADRLMLVVALSMLLTPLLFILLDRVIAPRFARDEAREADEITEHGHRDHRRARPRRRHRQPDPARHGLHDHGDRLFARNSSKCCANSASTPISATPPGPTCCTPPGSSRRRSWSSPSTARTQITELARYAVKTWPHLHVIARAVDRNHVYDLWSVGCRDIVRETYDSSLRMGRSAIEALGIRPRRGRAHGRRIQRGGPQGDDRSGR